MSRRSRPVLLSRGEVGCGKAVEAVEAVTAGIGRLCRKKLSQGGAVVSRNGPARCG